MKRHYWLINKNQIDFLKITQGSLNANDFNACMLETRNNLLPNLKKNKNRNNIEIVDSDDDSESGETTNDELNILTNVKFLCKHIKH